MPPVLVVILNAPPHQRIHRVQLRLAELLGASWERIDPFCQLDGYRDFFPEDVADGFDDGVAAVEDALARQRNLVLEWRLAEQTYERLGDVFDGQACKFVLLTFAPPLAATMVCCGGRELEAKKRIQVRRFYERGCHQHTKGLVVTDMDSDPGDAATVILQRLRDQRLLP